MPHKTTKPAFSGKPAPPQISSKRLQEPIPGTVTKEEFEGNFQSFKRSRKP